MQFGQLILYALQASLFGLILSIGLESRLTDISFALSRPVMLIKAIIAVNVLVPVTVVVLCTLLPVAPWTRTALVAVSVSPLAPFAPLKMLKTGAERSFVVGAYVALLLAAIVILPATAAILSFVAPRKVDIPALVVAAYVIKTVIIPLALGIFIHRLWEGFAERAAPVVRKLALGLLIVVTLLIFVRFVRDFIPLIGDGTLAVIAALVGTGLVSGYALGGPDLNQRRALAEAASTRHPGLAATIAQLHSNDPRIIAAIVLYLFASILFSTGFGLLISRIARTRPLTPGRLHP